MYTNSMQTQYMKKATDLYKSLCYINILDIHCVDGNDLIDFIHHFWAKDNVEEIYEMIRNETKEFDNQVDYQLLLHIIDNIKIIDGYESKNYGLKIKKEIKKQPSKLSNPVPLKSMPDARKDFTFNDQKVNKRKMSGKAFETNKENFD